LVITMLNAAPVDELRREGRAVQERRDAVIALCTEHGFANFLGQITAHYGWALAEQGELDEGITQIQEGLAACRATGARLFMSHFLLLLAEAYMKAEQCDMGLRAVSGALDVVRQNGEHLSEAELYRLKGELTLQKLSPAVDQLSEKSRVGSARQNFSPGEAGTLGGTDATIEVEAEACFLKAIEISRQQSAKPFELRAVMSLARLWQPQGKKQDAHQMLAEIYGWFTEGFDTKDLQEARVLLEELSH
jgi:predicted ATPase